MRNWMLAGGAIALMATCAVAQQGKSLTPECREKVVQLCGTERSKIRTCLKEKYRQLPQNCTSEIAERVKGRGGMAMVQTSAKGATEFAYGSDPLQKLDFWRETEANAPLIIFMHGGGWKRGDKNNATGDSRVSHYLAQGYAFASINYRLIPAATVEQQAADVASAIAYVRKNAKQLGIDPKKIVLMGHSAGAHLAALVGTDPQYLRAAGLDVSALSGVIPLDVCGV